MAHRAEKKTTDLEKVKNAKCGTPAALLRALGINGIPDVTMSVAVARRFFGESTLNEWSICWDREVSPQTHLGRAVMLLAILYGKWRGKSDEDALLRMAEHAEGELWLGTIFPWLDTWQAEQLDWRQAIERMLEWLVLRHDQVKFQSGNSMRVGLKLPTVVSSNSKTSFRDSEHHVTRKPAQYCRTSG